MFVTNLTWIISVLHVYITQVVNCIKSKKKELTWTESDNRHAVVRLRFEDIKYHLVRRFGRCVEMRMHVPWLDLGRREMRVRLANV